MSRCSKPNCSASASAALAYDYDERLAILDVLPKGMPSPHVYALCMPCADRLTAPFGWTLSDRRPAPDPDLTGSVADGSAYERAERPSGDESLLFGAGA